MIDGITTSDPECVKKNFQTEWAEVFTSKSGEKPLPKWLQNIKKKDYTSQLNKLIMDKEIKVIIDKLKNGKAAGKDHIFNELLKHLPTEMIECLADIFNTCISQKTLPSLWRESVTSLLYKGKGNRTEPMNFRPIALISCVYKIYSHIQNNRLTEWMELNTIIDEHQFGFRRGVETTDAAARLFSVIQNANKNNKNLHVIFLDVAKAYDSVEHWSLIQTLRAYGLHQDDIQIISSIITCNTTQLTTAYGPTADIKLTRGVRQGDIISPALYSLFLNPLLNYIKENADPYRIGRDEFSVGAYADDMTMISASKKGVENMMTKVNEFMDFNNVIINHDKSTYHWLGNEEAELKTRNNDLKREGDIGLFTYLGWTTNLRLDWNDQIDNLMTKYHNCIHQMLQEKNLTLNQRVKLINTIIHPMILYRTNVMYVDHNIWLSELDRWTKKILNKRGGLDYNISAQYWHDFRGLNHILIEANAAFLQHAVNKKMNDEKTCLAVKAVTETQIKDCLKDLKLSLISKKSDYIENHVKDKNVIAALHNADILYLRQLQMKGKWMTWRQLDKINMDAPVQPYSRMDAQNQHKYDDWTVQLSKLLRTLPIDTIEPNKIEYTNDNNKTDFYTDGSVKDYKATWAVYNADNSPLNFADSTKGTQEINNAELQAIQHVLEFNQDKKYIDIYSDSLNAIRFCTKGLLESNRRIRNQDNANTKLIIKKLMMKRIEDGFPVGMVHIRSHAEDTAKVDHEIRRKQNNEKFGEKVEEREKGNKAADQMAGKVKWRDITLDVETKYDQFHIVIDERELDGNTRRKIRTLLYQQARTQWKTTQPKWSAFTNELAWSGSLPNKYDKYANLTCKIMTGTIWTNKRKFQRMKKADQDLDEIKDKCETCSEILGENITESHEHVLGECLRTIMQKEELWEEIKRLAHKLEINMEGLSPWFTCISHYPDLWDLPEWLGDKGLIPMQLIPRIKYINNNITNEKVKIFLQGIRYLKYNRIRTIYLRRYGEGPLL